MLEAGFYIVTEEITKKTENRSISTGTVVDVHHLPKIPFVVIKPLEQTPIFFHIKGRKIKHILNNCLERFDPNNIKHSKQHISVIFHNYGML